VLYGVHPYFCAQDSSENSPEEYYSLRNKKFAITKVIIIVRNVGKSLRS